LKHFTSPDFWTLFNELPAHVQQLARANYELRKTNPAGLCRMVTPLEHSVVLKNAAFFVPAASKQCRCLSANHQNLKVNASPERWGNMRAIAFTSQQAGISRCAEPLR
jgi:hypothetical protein